VASIIYGERSGMHAGSGSFNTAIVPCVPAARRRNPAHLLRIRSGKVALKRPTRSAWTRSVEAFSVTRTHSRGKKWAPATTGGFLAEIETDGGGGAAEAAATVTAARIDPAASTSRGTIRKWYTTSWHLMRPDGNNAALLAYK
jgi:hypothetical protein